MAEGKYAVDDVEYINRRLNEITREREQALKERPVEDTWDHNKNIQEYCG